MIKVFIADDHFHMRRSIKQILSAEKGISVAGEASNSQEVMLHADKFAWDVMILDIVMPDRSGLDLLPEIMAKNPDSRILILSMYRDKELVERAFKEGAIGYLDKENINKELVPAVMNVYKGNKYIGKKIGL